MGVKLKLKGKSDEAWIVMLLFLFVGVPLILGVSFFVGGAVVYSAWNYGVGGVTTVTPITYKAACFISLGLSIVGNVLRPRSAG